MMRFSSRLFFAICWLALGSESIAEDDPNDVVSYIMEPFEEFLDDAATSDLLSELEVSVRSNETVMKKNSVASLTSTAKFGSGSLQIEYEGPQTYLVESTLSGGRVHNCFGASTLSLWYRHQPVRGRTSVQPIVFSFELIDSDCLADDASCSEVWRYKEVDGMLLGTELFVWQELVLSMDPLFWELSENGAQGNGSLDLNTIVGWRFKFETEDNGILLLDHLSFSGPGELLGSAFFANDFLESLGRKDMVSIYFDSEISEESTFESLGDGTLELNYTVQQRETWGGFIQYQHMVPSRAYFNLSKAEGISIEYYIEESSSVKGRVILRYILLDGSHCKSECGYNASEVENYYSFHYVMDGDGNGTLTLPLEGDTTGKKDFHRNGWFGVSGNDVLDPDRIKGWKFDIGLDSQGAENSLVTGAFSLSNVSALSEYNTSLKVFSQFTPEPLLRLLPVAGGFHRVEHVGHTNCNRICDANPTCFYAMTDRRGDCFWTETVPKDAVELLNNGITVLDTDFFWKNNLEARGDLCERCRCSEQLKTIDCRGMNLTTVPIFTLDWSPRVLDLRNNPKLTLILSGSLSRLSSVEELRLPANLAYVGASIIDDVPSLDKVTFEGYDPEVWPREGNFMNMILDSSGFFSNQCCSIGEHIELAGGRRLSFCNMIHDTPGADTEYEEFVQYIHLLPLQTRTATSDFMFEAAESAEKCAEYCHILEGCKYFSFDNRVTISTNVCWHFADAGNSTRVCCHEEHYADKNMTKPGWISGRVPRTRRVVDNARVLLNSTMKELKKSNNYTAQLTVSLGAHPSRGAVWVEPYIAAEDSAKVWVFSPPRVALYDNETEQVVDIHLANGKDLKRSGPVTVKVEVESCDAAFSTSNYCSATEEITELFTFISEHDGVSNVVKAILAALLAALTGLLALLYVERKKRLADAVWHIKKNELEFKNPAKVLGCGSFGYVLLAEYRGTDVAVKRVLPPRKAEKTVGFDHNITLRRQVDSALDSEHAKDFEGGVSESQCAKSLVGHKTPVGWERRMLESIPVGRQEFNASLIVSPSSSIAALPKRRWSKLTLGRRADGYARMKSNFVAEMRHLSTLRHPCITTVMGAVVDYGVEPMLVMEYMYHGSLYDLLHNETMRIEGEHILYFLRDIAQGLRFLHAAVKPQVIHGDLKAQNILVDSKFRAKVADFGLSQKKKLGASGSPYWMAPELLRGESTNTTMSDVFSFGIILYEVYSRLDPYDGEEFDEVVAAIADQTVNKRPPIPAACPKEIEVLMRQCCSGLPQLRPTFEYLDVQLRALNVERVEPGEFLGSFRKNKTESLLEEVFPQHIAEALRQGRKVQPESRDLVTIFFSDIVGFTNISGSLSPLKVSDLLDRLYTKFDALSRKHDIFKVETIGDSWMGVTNLVQDQPDHVKRIAEFALDVRAAAAETLIDPEDPSCGCTSIRVGFHSGPVVANVVGSRNPRYCLFGDTVNTASRMESSSLHGHIQCSLRAANLLKEQCSDMPLTSRGVVDVKGKGLMLTYFVGEQE